MAPVLFPSSVKYWYPGSRFQLSLQLCHIIIMFLCPSISNAAVNCVCVCVCVACLSNDTHTKRCCSIFLTPPAVLMCVCVCPYLLTPCYIPFTFTPSNSVCCIAARFKENYRRFHRIQTHGHDSHNTDLRRLDKTAKKYAMKSI